MTAPSSTTRFFASTSPNNRPADRCTTKQLAAALEARDLPDLPRALRRAGGRFEDFLNADVLAALFAGRGDGGARFRLLVTATRAGHQDLSLFLRWHSKLSGLRHKYDDVRGKGFFAQTRRERRAYPTVDL